MRRRDRDPAPEIRKPLFGLSGCGGFARRGHDSVGDVDGRRDHGAGGNLRTEGWKRRGAGQVTSAAPLDRGGSRQRLSLRMFGSFVFLKKATRGRVTASYIAKSKLWVDSTALSPPTCFLKLSLSLSREGGWRLDFWASWALAMWALESRRPVLGTGIYQSGPRTQNTSSLSFKSCRVNNTKIVFCLQ